MAFEELSPKDALLTEASVLNKEVRLLVDKAKFAFVPVANMILFIGKSFADWVTLEVVLFLSPKLVARATGFLVVET